MTADEFLETQKALLEEFLTRGEGPISIGNTDCVACVGCVFCTGCERSYQLAHCEGCTDSVLLTQCVRCKHSYASAYCEESEYVSCSNYLVRSLRCHDCNYCFGCVGLVGKEFHILNQPYSRSEYFKRVAALRKALGIRPSSRG